MTLIRLRGIPSTPLERARFDAKYYKQKAMLAVNQLQRIADGEEPDREDIASLVRHIKLRLGED